MKYIPFDEAKQTLAFILEKTGFSTADAAYLAHTFANNTLEGVESHGLNRFPRFMASVKSGDVQPTADIERISALGGLELWDAHLCAGPLVASRAMAKACHLAKTSGIAMVSVRNSSHWQRAGRYAWEAAEKNMVSILFTNTCQNLPAWGALDAQLGNNPMAIGIPRKKGAVVVDLSMSQFAYGRLEIAAQKGEKMPTAGGFDKQGRLTDDPNDILETRRVLPMGMWKGAALSLVLDMMAAGLSLGRTVHQIGNPSDGEKGLSQAYIAIHYTGLVDEAEAQTRFDDAVAALKASLPDHESSPVRYPGEKLPQIVKTHLKNGLPVHDSIWQAIIQYA